MTARVSVPALKFIGMKMQAIPNRITRDALKRAMRLLFTAE